MKSDKLPPPICLRLLGRGYMSQVPRISDRTVDSQVASLNAMEQRKNNDSGSGALILNLFLWNCPVKVQHCTSCDWLYCHVNTDVKSVKYSEKKTLWNLNLSHFMVIGIYRCLRCLYILIWLSTERKVRPSFGHSGLHPAPDTVSVALRVRTFAYQGWEDS